MASAHRTLGMVCALKQEAEALSTWVPTSETYWHHHFRWIHFQIHSVQIVIVVSKPGRKNAKKATRLLIEQSAPQWIINFGCAGAIAPHLNIGTMVVATSTAEYQIPLQPIHWVPTEPLFQSLFQPDLNIHLGPIISANQNVTTKELKQKLYQNYQALCVDWESAPIMQVCHDRRIPATAFRVITDLAEEQAIQQFNDSHASVLQAAADNLKQGLMRIGLL